MGGPDLGLFPLQPLPSLWGLERLVSSSYFFPCDSSVSAQPCRAAARWRCQDGWPRCASFQLLLLQPKSWKTMAMLKCVPLIGRSYLWFTLHLLKRVAVLVCAMGWPDSLLLGVLQLSTLPVLSLLLPVFCSVAPLRGMNPLFHICFASPSSTDPLPDQLPHTACG